MPDSLLFDGQMKTLLTTAVQQMLMTSERLQCMNTFSKDCCSVFFQGEFKVTERYLTMRQLCSALKQQRVKEMFGSGTACMICPIGHIVYLGEVL